MTADSTPGAVAGEYLFTEIERRWQAYWLREKTFRTTADRSKPKFYVLDMFPYPSGDGLHVGHPVGYTATDVVARYKRMRGFNVLHPMGWDAFGLPAEQYAVKTGTHPRVTTEKNIARFRQQLQAIGLSYDWDREVNTTDPAYYRWTQAIFLKLFERGLAYQSEEPVNWCPELGTVLANEEVIDGKSQVGGFPVIKRPIRQWVLKITAYAERLLEDLEGLDWPEHVKAMQRNWIGKSVGATVDFAITGVSGIDKIQVFTTRPDTLFGATFLVVAPEHPVASRAVSDERRAAVQAYVDAARQKADTERTAEGRQKTGVFTGCYAVSPVTGQPVPIWVADYVLMHYGSGAIMAVPAHDARDHAFAQTYNLPIVSVVAGGSHPASEAAFEGEGVAENSGFLNGMPTAQAKAAMVRWLAERGLGVERVTYRLRDWLFSRQRYWGEPIPLTHNAAGEVVPVRDDDLPVLLPQLEDFRPSGTGESPLARAHDWLVTEAGRRETNTMPQWAGSCWYYLRFIDPLNQRAPWDRDLEKYWMPVDLYLGGVEHAVLHLLYARFWHKVLFDCGWVSTPEPFQKLVNQGMVLGENGEKMSKSRGNVISPDDVIREWGADSLRLYEMFMGPLEAVKPWQTQGLSGVLRFLRRLWRLIIGEDGAPRIAPDGAGSVSPALIRQWHQTVAKVTDDIENLRCNTAISAMMEFVNSAYKESATLPRSMAEDLTLLVSPIAPHIAEEMWNRLGHGSTLAYESWPSFDPNLCVEDEDTYSVQVNGKLRGTLRVPKGLAGPEVIARARALESVARHLGTSPPRKEIFVPGKIVSFVV